jgi:hypothetical protein
VNFPFIPHFLCGGNKRAVSSLTPFPAQIGDPLPFA